MQRFGSVVCKRHATTATRDSHTSMRRAPKSQVQGSRGVGRALQLHADRSSKSALPLTALAGCPSQVESGWRRLTGKSGRVRVENIGGRQATGDCRQFSYACMVRQTAGDFMVELLWQKERLGLLKCQSGGCYRGCNASRVCGIGAYFDTYVYACLYVPSGVRTVGPNRRSL